jgi:CBS domain-containing protein
MSLLKIARVPAITVDSEAWVLDAVETMSRLNAGAVLVVENERAVGIFTASDLLKRVIARGLSLADTRVGQVMTSPLTVATAETHNDDALRLMVDNHIRHLPIVDREERALGILGTRHLLGNMVDDLSQEVSSLSAYMGADGIGGD